MKDSQRFLEMALPDVRHTGQQDNNTHRLGTGRDEALVKIEILVQSVILALALTGNTCVLAVLARKRKVTSRMHVFIFHLSIADLLVAVFNILPQLIWDITGTFHGGDTLCRYIKFMQIYVMYLSTYMLVMTAIDRYRAVCHPLSAFNSSSKTTIYVMIWAAYVISAILSLPQPIIFKIQEPEMGSGIYECWGNFDPPWTMTLYVISFTLAIYIVPLALLMFAYMSICRTICQKHRTAKLNRLGAGKTDTSSSDLSLASRHIYSSYLTTRLVVRRSGVIERRSHIVGRQRLPPSSAPRAHSLRGFSRAKMKTVQLTFVVIVAYVLCWSPFFVSQLWWLFDVTQENNHAVVVMILLGSLNSCCNPWIYLAFSGNLLRHVCGGGCCMGQKRCCQEKLCHRHNCPRPRGASYHSELQVHGLRSPLYDPVSKSDHGEFPQVELQELILIGSNRKWPTYTGSAPDTAGFTNTSKTLVSKASKVSEHGWKKDSLHKLQLTNGQLVHGAE